MIIETRRKHKGQAKENRKKTKKGQKDTYIQLSTSNGQYLSTLSFYLNQPNRCSIPLLRPTHISHPSSLHKSKKKLHFIQFPMLMTHYLATLLFPTKFRFYLHCLFYFFFLKIFDFLARRKSKERKKKKEKPK
jgi:hypothetical protein